MIDALAHAVTHPKFPLALGRRSCPPAQPLAVRRDTGEVVWQEPVLALLETTPWQASDRYRWRWARRHLGAEDFAQLPVTIDSEDSPGITRAGDVTTFVDDVPRSFDPLNRAFTTREVVHTWARIPTGITRRAAQWPHGHDPHELTGEA
jgi:CRISPR system Cascade subunit CasD